MMRGLIAACAIVALAVGLVVFVTVQARAEDELLPGRAQEEAKLALHLRLNLIQQEMEKMHAEVEALDAALAKAMGAEENPEKTKALKAKREELLRRKEAMRARNRAIQRKLIELGVPDVAPPPEDPEEPHPTLDRLIMVNGDKVTGTLQSIEEDVISIRPPYVTGDIRIPLKNVARIHFRKPSARLFPGPDQVLFSKGQVLSGTLISMDKEKFMLESDYASTLNIRKSMVEAIMLSGEDRLVLGDDFSKMSDRWKIHSGTWKVKEGKLVQDQHRSNRYISAAVQQEGELTYEWEVASPEGPLQCAFTFFASNPDNCWGGNAYAVFITGNSVFLYHAQNNSLGSEQRGLFREKSGKVRFKVHYDPEKGQIKVWANSKKPVITYTDGSPWKSGSHIILMADRPTTFDDLSITRGHGLPGDMRKGSEASDVIHFRNRDRVSGEVKAISKDMVTLGGEHGKMDLNRGKVVAIVFNQRTVAKAGEDPGAAILTLRNSEKLTLEIQSLDEKVLAGDCPYTGAIKIDRWAIKEIVLPNKR